MSSVSLRKLRITPLRVDRCSRTVVLPAWWYRLKQKQLEFEVDVSLNAIGIRPVDREIESEKKSEVKDTPENGVEKWGPR